MKREDLIPGEIYKYKYRTGAINIFRATKNLVRCIGITPHTISLFSFNSDDLLNFYSATQDEIIWFEYCEKLGDYKEKQEALENKQLLEFIKENILQ